MTLTSSDLALCADLATRRNKSAYTNKRAPKNRAPNDWDTSLRVHRIGVCAEYVAKCYFDHPDLKWHDYAENVRGLPDLETPSVKIDVKGVSASHLSLIVQRDDPPNWSYLLVVPDYHPPIVPADHPTYRIIGWCWGHEAQQIRLSDPARKGRPAHFVRQNSPLLKCPSELLAISIERSANV